MAIQISPKAAARLAALDGFQKNVQHVHGLVEQYAVAVRHGREAALSMPIRRSFGQLKVAFMGIGLDQLSQLAGSMEIAASRGSNPTRKIRILRDGVASIRQQLELEERLIKSEEKERWEAELAAESDPT